MSLAQDHYIKTMRVKAHAAIHYARDSKFAYNDADRSKIRTDTAHLSNLLTNEASLDELKEATDNLFSTITFALGRGK